jgi:hypothetical protein
MRIQNPKKTNNNNNNEKEEEEEKEASSSQGSLTSPAKGFLHAYSAINSTVFLRLLARGGEQNPPFVQQ